MVVHPVHHEIGEPGGLSRSLEKLVEELEALLTEVVAEDLEGHQGGSVVEQRLCQEGQTVIIDVVVCQIDVHQRLILGNRLREGLRAIVTDLVVGDVKGLKGAVRALKVLCNCLTALEGDLVGIQVKHFEGVVLKEVLHNDVNTIIS